METRTDDTARKKVLDLLKDARIGMMATRHGDGSMHSRPMATNHADFQGELFYLTDSGSEKVADIEAHPEVMIAYADTGKQHYVSVSGKGSIVRDRSVIKDLWFEPARTWFPNGPDDPDLIAIKVHVEHAEYWDAPSSTMLYAYGYLKAVTTGEPPKRQGDAASVKF